MNFNKKILLLSGICILVVHIILFVYIGNPRSREVSTSPVKEELIVYTWTGDDYYRSAAEKFKALYGVSVRIVVTKADVYIRKSIAEKDSLSGSIDCMIVNSSNQLEQLVVAGVLPANKFVPFYSTVSGFLYDSAILQHPPLSWEDFNRWINLNPEKFGFTPVGGEGGFSFIYSVINRFSPGGIINNKNISDCDKAWQWFRDKQKKMLLTSSDYETMRLFSSGKLHIACVTEPQMVEALKRDKLPETVKMVEPEFGSLSQTYGIVIPLNAPEGRNAIRFVRFLKEEESLESMKKMLSVPVSVETFSGRSLNPPGTRAYRNIVDSFKAEVLYY